MTRIIEAQGGDRRGPAVQRALWGVPILGLSPRFVLVDRQVRMRGTYERTDAEALGRLRRDVKDLLRDQ